MPICDHCACARPKLDHAAWIECKLRDIPPVQIMQAYMDFMEQRGRLETPFHLVGNVNTTAEHAWPFQFDPQVIVECSGFREEKEEKAG